MLALWVQTQAWMTDHRRKVAAKIKAEKVKQQAPVQRRAVARQKAAASELEQVNPVTDCTHFCDEACH